LSLTVFTRRLIVAKRQSGLLFDWRVRRRPDRTTLALECSTPSIALDIHLEDCRVMDEAIDRGQRHSLIWKDFSPFAKADWR
jgi:hypothetical protein